MNKILKNIWHAPRRVVVFLIWIYQRTISPDHGMFRDRFPHGYCKFYPTCSEYGRLVIEKRGVVVGGILALWRILRCNPFGRGGVDWPS
ncbi:MAG TPA: membrane protein insertion efficiency factor YidD [Candidatus Magasanikbacteria bacterium]|nr:membrane protein insertion efficiency factor YidD [Candidatus Magasanikbacteria bacterium]